ncbi:MAG: hypothetical protein P1U74_04500 [Legionellaceae bacterium]|nr:hypothetical protein [Legionellaceae bacterium]
MYSIGPILVRTTFVNMEHVEYHWCYIKLNSENTVLNFSLGYFSTSDTELPNDFTIYQSQPALFHVFDPSVQSYYSLIISSENKLIKFRPNSLPNNFTPYIAEIFKCGGYTPKKPVERATVQITTNGYEALYNALKSNPEILDSVESQYQLSRSNSIWQTEQKDVVDFESIHGDARAVLVKNGFLLGLLALKAEAQNSLDYCYALLLVIIKEERANLIRNKLILEVGLLYQVEQFRLYLVDFNLYDAELHPLNQELFNVIQKLLISEIDKYKHLKSADTEEITITFEDLLDHNESRLKFTNALRERNRSLNNTADAFFLMLTKQVSLPDERDSLRYIITSITDMKSSSSSRSQDLYELLKDEFEAHFYDKNFSDELGDFYERAYKKYKGMFKRAVTIHLNNSKNDDELYAKLTPMIHSSSDIKNMLILLGSDDKQCTLIDTLNIEDPECSWMKNPNDFFNFSAPLRRKSLLHLFSKRTPKGWCRIIANFEQLLSFCKSFRIPEQKLSMFSANAKYIASLIDTDFKLLNLLPYINPKQLQVVLYQIPTTITCNWFQTKNGLGGLLQLDEGAYLNDKISLVLNALPNSFRVTAIIRIEDPLQAAFFLGSLKSSLLDLYWKSLEDSDWEKLFPTPIQFKILAIILINHNYLGQIILEKILQNIPGRFKNQLLQNIKSEPESETKRMMLNYLKKHIPFRQDLDDIGLPKDSEMERPLKCSRLKY